MTATAFLLLGLGLGLGLLLVQRFSMAQLNRRIRAHEAALEARLGERIASALERAETHTVDLREIPRGFRVEIDEHGQRWVRPL